MPALFDNFQSGVITDNPLTIGAVAFNSATLAGLPTIAGTDYMWIVLDPAQVNGAPEVVKVTAHGPAATVATIARAQQFSTARAHPVNTVWVHLITEADAQEWVPKAQEINVQAGAAYTLLLTDRGKLIQRTNAGASTVTIPTNAVAAFNLGDSVDILQHGAGQITIDGAGVTLRSTPTLKLRAQYSGCTLKKIGTNEWWIVGDMASS